MPDQYSVPVRNRVQAARDQLADLHTRQTMATRPYSETYIEPKVLSILGALIEIVDELAANKWTSADVR